jgi:hypothetical protein
MRSRSHIASKSSERMMRTTPDYVPPDAAAAAAAQDPNLAARRAQMIQACEDNNGIDCATQVDTELAAEQMEAGGVRHLAPR